MKKTLLALAVMAVAGTANAAATLHDADGVKATLAGSVDVKLEKIGGAKANIALGDADATFAIEVAAGDDLTVFGNYAVKTAESADDVKAKNAAGTELDVLVPGAKVTAGDINGGFKGSWGTVTLGQAGSAFSAGTTKAKTAKLENAKSGLEENNVVKYEHTVNDVSFAVSYDIDADDKKSGFAGNVSGTFSGLTVKASAATLSSEGTDNTNTYGVTLTYAQDAFSAGIAGIQEKTGNAKDTDFDVFVGYKADDTQFYLGADSSKAGDKDTERAYYLNATHTLHANVSLYGEVGKKVKDNVALVGFNVKF